MITKRYGVIGIEDSNVHGMTCSACDVKKETLKLSERMFHCAVCGASLNRDVNAAINIGNTVSSTEINACGVGKVHAARQVPDAETGRKH